MVAVCNRANYYIVALWFLSLPAALRAAQACQYLIYSEADFKVFRPAGVTRCTNWDEIWHVEGPVLRAKFHPIGATTRV